MTQVSTEGIVVRTTREFTVRWSPRLGDYLIWLRRDPRLGMDVDSSVIDLWAMPDGAFVTITNRPQDFPSWFDLHPLEVKNSLMGWMASRLAANNCLVEPVDGPNVWRVRGGERVIWVGPPRPGQTDESPVLGALDCREAVAVLGEHRDGIAPFMRFEEGSDTRSLLRAGLEAERRLGPGRVFASEWKLG